MERSSKEVKITIVLDNGKQPGCLRERRSVVSL